MAQRTEWSSRLRSLVASDPVDCGSVATGEYWIRADNAELKEAFGDVLLRVELVAGTLTCTGLHLEQAGGIDARTLHSLPLGAVSDFVFQLARLMPALGLPAPPPEGTAQAQRGRGRAGLSDDHFRQVAEYYAVARVQRPTAPVKWMADHVYAGGADAPSLETVRRWVRQARQRGYINSEETS